MSYDLATPLPILSRISILTTLGICMNVFLGIELRDWLNFLINTFFYCTFYELGVFILSLGEFLINTFCFSCTFYEFSHCHVFVNKFKVLFMCQHMLHEVIIEICANLIPKVYAIQIIVLVADAFDRFVLINNNKKPDLANLFQNYFYTFVIVLSSLCIS